MASSAEPPSRGAQVVDEHRGRVFALGGVRSQDGRGCSAGLAIELKLCRHPLAHTRFAAPSFVAGRVARMRTYVLCAGPLRARKGRLSARCPGLETERVRTFDAPEALGINFHEVRAKSALNKVPGTYLPFNWTVNAFRGCTHACTFCFARQTHTYLDLNAGRDFEREIVVKVNVPELLAAELRRAELEAGAGRVRDQHRSLPVGRGALRADAADARGAARDRDAGVGAVEVAAAAAGPGALPAAGGGGRRQRQLLDPDDGGEGLARDRAPHPTPPQADGGGRGSSTRRGFRQGC